MIDWDDIDDSIGGTRHIDPIEIFNKDLVVRDPDLNDLWLAQGDALREWHDARSERDIAVVLNTGAGKTLVGLLIAQSLVNEKEDKVVYVCPSIQLVEQTAKKAEGYGLEDRTDKVQSVNSLLTRLPLGKSP